jgi:Co/Zn/Cd efflux system component
MQEDSDAVAVEIANPKLVVIVGSLGLASNIVGLFLFRGQLSLHHVVVIN